MNTFLKLARVATVLCLCVVILGAWVRLTDAGLGCPDWPGCYGELIVPADPGSAAAWPERPLDSGKAWREMIHRYAAGTLGMLVLALAWISWRRRHQPGQPVALSTFLLVLIVFQALLGMWTVTLLLKPVVVMSHLMGGMATLAILFWLARQPVPLAPMADPGLRRFALLGLIVLSLQIALGGWVSTNYAALACPDLPTCQGRYWPPMDFITGFDPWHGIGIDYEGGILNNAARVAIHFTHRVGAVVTAIVLGLLAWRAGRHPGLKQAALWLAVMLVTQLALGLVMVATQLPLSLATAHNGVAALLLLSVVNLNRMVRYEN